MRFSAADLDEPTPGRPGQRGVVGLLDRAHQVAVAEVARPGRENPEERRPDTPAAIGFTRRIDELWDQLIGRATKSI